MNKKFMLLSALLLSSLTFVASDADVAAPAATEEAVVDAAAPAAEDAAPVAVDAEDAAPEEAKVGFVTTAKAAFTKHFATVKAHTLDWATAKTAEHPVKALVVAAIVGGVTAHYAIPVIQGLFAEEEDEDLSL